MHLQRLYRISAVLIASMWVIGRRIAGNRKLLMTSTAPPKRGMQSYLNIAKSFVKPTLLFLKQLPWTAVQSFDVFSFPTRQPSTDLSIVAPSSDLTERTSPQNMEVSCWLPQPPMPEVNYFLSLLLSSAQKTTRTGTGFLATCTQS